MPTVEHLILEPLELAHPDRQISIHSLYQQMVMIVHEAVGMAAPPIAHHHLSQHGKKLLPVVGIAIDPLPGVAARGHVIDSAGKLEAEWARHAGALASAY
jgi:hypothetical protein